MPPHSGRIRDLGVRIHMNTCCKPEDLKGYDYVFVATGARERKLDLPGFDSPQVTYAIDTLLQQNIKSGNVVVIGAGQTGMEIAYDLTLKGCKVTVVEAEQSILNVEGMSAAIYNMMMDIIDYYQIDVRKNAVAQVYEDGKLKIRRKTFFEPNARGRASRTSVDPIVYVNEEIPADHVVVSVGYLSDDTLFRQVLKVNPNVKLLGDAEKPGNLLHVIWQAYAVAREI